MKSTIQLAKQMKMKTRFKNTSILAAISMLCLTISLLFLIECTGGTGEGNPEFGIVSVSLGAKAGQAGIPSPAGMASRSLSKSAANDTLLVFDAGNAPYALHHIYAHIDRIEIERPKGVPCRSTDSVVCTDSTVIVSGPRFIDLLKSPSPLILDKFPLPLGSYNRMKVRFSKLADTGDVTVPAEYLPLVGHSILMRGSFAYNGVPNRNLSIYLDIDEAFEFRSFAGLTVATDLPYNWAGVFLAGGWLRNLGIRNCLDSNQIPLEPDGGLVIDSGTACNDLEDSIKVNLRGSTVFELEDEEDDDDI